VDIGLTPAVAKTVGSAVLKTLGGLVPGAVRETRRRRAIRRTVAELLNKDSDAVLRQLSRDEERRLASFVQLPDFEQIAVQLTGLALERKRPERYVDDLRKGLSQSLRLHSVASLDNISPLAEYLLAVLQSAVSLTIGELGQSQHPADMPGLTIGVSHRAAAAARNSDLLKRFDDLNTIHSFTDAIRTQTSKVEGRLRPAQLASGNRVPLNRLYVERHLTKPGPFDGYEPDRYLPKDVLNANLRTVVLGDPGGGKSTLAAKLCCDLARSRRAECVVPFLIVMRDFSRHFEHEQMSIARYLRAHSSSRYQVETTNDCIEFLLLNGRAVVFFDGLDELVETSLRRRVVDAVEAFAHAYPLTTLLVTSRVIGYEQAPLDAAFFASYQLAEFDESQVEAYTRKWFALDSSMSPNHQQELSNAFLRDAEYVADLRTNPLMLSLMCALYRDEGYIPRNRLDVYDRCSTLLFEGWDRSRGIHVGLPFRQHVRPALWSLALAMLESDDGRTAWTERELVTVVRRFLLERRFEDPDEADEAASSFVAYCRGRAWVLNEMGTTADGEPFFSFTHRTFMEYFAAGQLVRTNPTPTSLFDVLRARIGNAEWDVVVQLAVLVLDRNIDNGADEFLTHLVRAVRDTEQNTHRAPLLMFATRLMEHLVPAPSIRREVFDACWHLAAQAEGDHDDRIRPLARLLVAADENRAAITAMIRERATDENIPGILAVLVVTLDQLAPSAAFNRDQWMWWYAESRENAASVRNALSALAPHYAPAATELVLCGAMSITDLVTVHGPAAVCERPKIASSYRRMPLLQQEVLASHETAWQKWVPYAAIETTAGTWADELAMILPGAPTPWARLSGLPHWDMTIDSPTNNTPPGTSRFDILVLAACLLSEARDAVRRRQGLEIDSGRANLPSWLRLAPAHPLNKVMSAAIQGPAAVRHIPEPWLSPGVHAFLLRWSAREISLVVDDLEE
jgi:hypothetical protein